MAELKKIDVVQGSGTEAKSGPVKVHYTGWLHDPAAVDPEELFIASLASCHMLWFLDIVSREGFRVDRYEDAAEGVMEKNAEGKVAITHVTLRPAVQFSGEKLPSRADIERLHHKAHEECFIASSVKTDVRCEPR